jgi:hypothetical protein
MRQRLGELIDPATICRTFEAEHGPLSWQDLELLATVEDYLKENEPGENSDG